MIFRLLLVIFIFHITSSAFAQQPSTLSPKIGDINFDPSIDDPRFKTCNETVAQYYMLKIEYEGGFKEIKKQLLEKFNSTFPVSDNFGFMTIRFVVNCKGKTGLFRVSQVDRDYEEFEFPKEQVAFLLNEVRHLEGWKPVVEGNYTFDFYYYFNFKIEKGHILEIIP